MSRSTKRIERIVLIFVEGECEEKGLPKLLKEDIAALQNRLQCTVRVVQLRGEGQFYSGIGGLVANYMRDVRYNILAILTLVDLHPTSRFKTITEKQEAIRKAIPNTALKIWYPHWAVHDIEAWIWADHQALASYLKAQNLTYHGQPEELNSGTPPKEYLNRAFMQHKRRRYSETIDGTVLLGLINPMLVEQKCPRFAALRETLRSLTS